MGRGQIIHEYIQLRDYLNRANKLSNQATDFQFEIEEVELLTYKLFAVLVSKNESHRLCVAERGRQKTWERTGTTRFLVLEEACAELLNKYESQTRAFKVRKLSDETLMRFSKALATHFKMLFLDKGYEP